MRFTIDTGPFHTDQADDQMGELSPACQKSTFMGSSTPSFVWYDTPKFFHGVPYPQIAHSPESSDHRRYGREAAARSRDRYPSSGKRWSESPGELG